MKTTTTLLLMAVLAAGTFRTLAQPGGTPPPAGANAPALLADTNAPGTTAPTQPPPATPPEPAAGTAVNVPAVPAADGGDTNGLRMNFRNAPLDKVLEYLSDAAGFQIVLDTTISGNVTVISSHPMTRDEAVDLLNSVLNKNGYAAIRNDPFLTIVSKSDAKTRDIPVKTGNNPGAIPKNDEIVTQIIPISYVEAKQLVTDLSSFVSPQATIMANEAGNSIVVTDTQSNIRHLAEIIRAIDNSAEGETQIRVFRLTHANPADVASELGQIFPSTSGTGNNQSPIRFGGGSGGGGPGGFFQRMMAANAGGGGGTSTSQNPRIQKQSQVVAVADSRTQSVIVTASKDLMEQIAGMMDQLDVPSTRDQKVFVFHMNNGDPQQALQVLQNTFGSSTTTSRGGSSSSSQNSALMQRAQNNASSSSTSVSGSSSSGLGGASSRTGTRTGTGQSF
jgi:type II secretory pathway component GspD/PulD (secretin)